CARDAYGTGLDYW
nr:immunoglobulin heavy chain junction region [Macaca mulatta]MOV36069.1 immunoglobulin heavy chain junction region [Macaca mulatta]MOV36290.1 immunoglobulin heavy chain junction region [Macaca mulatta]MOV36448.1 immunoglobulin heavy chain junction region [Macaca mulatta]MOV36809.1 immunoglobulin heavy chain junction region [Macaca mulatta]